jgi:hypothetical protein
MVVKFSTRFGQVLMLGEPAVALLRLGGHSGTVPSAVLTADLPQLLARLREGLAVHGDAFSPAPPPRDPADDRDDPRDRPVTLRQRAVPLLDLIETAVRQHSDLMWERG